MELKFQNLINIRRRRFIVTTLGFLALGYLGCKDETPAEPVIREHQITNKIIIPYSIEERDDPIKNSPDRVLKKNNNKIHFYLGDLIENGK